MGGYALFFGSTVLGYAGSRFGHLAYKGHKWNQRQEEAKIRREVQRKLRPEGARSKDVDDDVSAAMATIGLAFLALAAIKSLVDR
ncbi:hypothetical protein ACP70R_011853 [Stipagrostis hirtigluma subsp. patula]